MKVFNPMSRERLRSMWVRIPLALLFVLLVQLVLRKDCSATEIKILGSYVESNSYFRVETTRYCIAGKIYIRTVVIDSKKNSVAVTVVPSPSTPLPESECR